MCMKTRWMTTVVLIAVLAGLCGCGGGASQPGPDVPLSVVDEEIQTLKPEVLIERIRIYRELALKEIEEIKKLDEKIAYADPRVVPETELEALKAQRELHDKTRLALVQRHQMYLQRLVRYGYNVGEFRIEEEEPQNILEEMSPE